MTDNKCPECLQIDGYHKTGCSQWLKEPPYKIGATFQAERLEEIVLELRKMNSNENNENVAAAIAYLDCAMWNIDNKHEVYKVVPTVVTTHA